MRAAGFDDVFNDVHAIKLDEQSWPRIEQVITDCDTIVVVITAATTISEWFKREDALARSLGMRIPVRRESRPLPLNFTDRYAIDFRHPTATKAVSTSAGLEAAQPSTTSTEAVALKSASS